MIISTAYGSKSFCSIYYNMVDNKICPNDIFKIMFDNDFFDYFSYHCKKENSNAIACTLSLMWVWIA